ncbi:MAG: flagellar brake protein [Firmicutes bacterium]|nr:flagellar brake protein [Bacillota bacterium]
MVKRIKPGDRVEIGFQGDNKGERRRLPTTVEFVPNDKEILVLMPMSAGSLVKLPIARAFETRFYTGSDIIIFDATVLEHPVMNGLYLTKFGLDSAGERIQLRNYHRISSRIEFTFSVVDEDFNVSEQTLVMHNGVIEDLSGGGMRFVSDFLIYSDTNICANFLLDGEYVILMCRVLGWQGLKSGNHQYQYRCQFLNSRDPEQEKVIKFINNQRYK